MNPQTFVQFGQIIESLIGRGYRCQDAGSTKKSVWANFVWASHPLLGDIDGEKWMSVVATWEDVTITDTTDPDHPKTVAIESIIGGKE